MQSLRARLQSGTPLLGLCFMYPSAGAVERIAPDWDWIWVDGQHGQLGYQDILAIVRACDLVQRPAIVRVPAHEIGPIGRALDTGAAGVLVPQVDTVQQAEAMVRAAKFPPLGNRSYGGRRPVDRDGRVYSETANEDTLLIVQIESPAAIDNAAAIAAVPGVDGLFLGPDDITLRRGISVTAGRTKELLGADLEAMAKACRAHGKIAATVGATPELLTACVQLGYQLIVATSDVWCLANTSQQRAAEARALLKGMTPPPAAAPAQTGSAY